MKYIVDSIDSNKRLDVYASEKIDGYTRSYIKKLIDLGYIRVNDKGVKAGYVLKTNDEITIDEIEKKEMTIKPKNIDINIMYEDDDIIIINKEKGMVVHPRKWKL